jgi:hypothetical protein
VPHPLRFSKVGIRNLNAFAEREPAPADTEVMGLSSYRAYALGEVGKVKLKRVAGS